MYRKSLNSKISYIFYKTLVFCIICSNCGNNNSRIFKEEESIQILKILGSTDNIKLTFTVLNFPSLQRTIILKT